MPTFSCLVLICRVRILQSSWSVTPQILGPHTFPGGAPACWKRTAEGIQCTHPLACRSVPPLLPTGLSETRHFFLNLFVVLSLTAGCGMAGGGYASLRASDFQVFCFFSRKMCQCQPKPVPKTEFPRLCFRFGQAPQPPLGCYEAASVEPFLKFPVHPHSFNEPFVIYVT